MYMMFTLALVALLAEGVDRNRGAASFFGAACVALLAEGVDRNQLFDEPLAGLDGRPPRGGRG